MKVLGLVPARGGSKGIPRKNIRRLGEKPLLAFTAEAALAANRLAKVVLSTEDEEIADVGKAYGLQVPFLRPAELATDQTPTLPVVQHAVTWFQEQGELFDAVCLLQPTTPFRAVGEIDGCIQRMEETGADTVFTVRSVPHEYNPHWVYKVADDGGLVLATGEAQPIPRRQDLPPAYFRDGSVYVINTETLLQRNSLYGPKVVGFSTTGDQSVNLDTMDDWAEAERFIADQGAG